MGVDERETKGYVRGATLPERLPRGRWGSMLSRWRTAIAKYLDASHYLVLISLGFIEVK